ncbi:MAG: response regulator, partial [Gammaproteobacteria bacterium]|nr:response regulator [Gammaproteobacteria bacterium]
MSTTGKPPSQQLLELQKLFHQQLPEKISDISIVWRLLSDQDNLRLSDVSEWHRKVHSLAGSGSTFGAFSVSKAALELEVVIEALVEIGENSALVFSDSVKTQISILVTELEKSARKWQPSNIPFIPQITTDHKGENAGKNLVYLVEDDTLLAAEITEHLVAADYDVKHFEGIADFEQACDQNIPAAVIMDMVLSEGNSAGAEAITRMKAKYEVAPPVVIISVRTDIHSRLAAARAGALRYFSKPVDMDSLIQTINGLTARVAKKPYRVLIIDDDPILLEYYSAILKGAGFLVKSLDNPL